MIFYHIIWKQKRKQKQKQKQIKGGGFIQNTKQKRPHSKKHTTTKKKRNQKTTQEKPSFIFEQ